MNRQDILYKTLKAFAENHILFQQNYIQKKLTECDFIVKNILLVKLNALKTPTPEYLETIGYTNLNISTDIIALEKNQIGDVFDFNSLESKQIYRGMMQLILANKKYTFKTAYKKSLLTFIDELGNLETLKKDLERKNTNLPLKTQILESISLDFFIFFDKELREQ